MLLSPTVLLQGGQVEREMYSRFLTVLLKDKCSYSGFGEAVLLFSACRS